eukprot:CAMPEP_0184866634 /NCGR_PEP_ID=MMETSP0580-20130426/23105_1 /TAXON_ID=1118495 /ORGANISM="Dactyliosolen fragilissimus" /LENGTH=279 /DNA_ID=CAMNT_0027366427 /DNA_START=94 /DNA_END=933 /DNA_ORIENTATION=+
MISFTGVNQPFIEEESFQSVSKSTVNYITVEDRSKRRRTSVEDAFKSLSLDELSRTDTSISPAPSFMSSPYCNQNQGGYSSMDEPVEHNSNMETSDTYSNFHGLDNDFISSTSSLRKVNQKDLNHLGKIYDVIFTPSLPQRSNPVDAKIEELIRKSRIQALVQTKKNVKTQIQSSEKKHKDYKYNSSDENSSEPLVTKDDINIKTCDFSVHSATGQKCGSKTKNSSKEHVGTRGRRMASHVENATRTKRSNSIPREMKYETNRRTNSNTNDYTMVDGPT